MIGSRFEKLMDFFNIKKRKKMKSYNDLFNLDMLTQYWRDRFFEVCQGLFEWDGLPFPQHEIDNILFENGVVNFIENKRFKLSNYAVTPCSISGVTEYEDFGTDVTWCTPLVSGSYKYFSDEGGVIIRNNSLSQPLVTLIEHYAILMANIDISLCCSLTNDRAQSIIVVGSQQAKEGIDSLFRQLEIDGARHAVVNDNLIKALQGAVSLPLVNAKDTIKPITEAYQTVLEMFYNDIGIKFNRNKKERMIDSEVTSDRQRLLINVNDMLYQRQLGAKAINDRYELNVSVKLASDIINNDNEEVNENDSQGIL